MENKTMVGSDKAIKKEALRIAKEKRAQEKLKYKGSIKKLFKYIKSYNIPFIIALLFAVGATVFTVLGPKYIGDMTQMVFEAKPLEDLARIGIMLVIFYLSSYTMNLIQQIIMALTTQSVSKKLRRDISKKINRLPLKYFDSTPKGDILSRITNDVDTISNTLAGAVSSLATSVTQIVGVIVIMLTLRWDLALVALGCILLSMFIIPLIIGKSQKHFVAQQKQLGELNGHIEEVYSGHNVIKVFNGEERVTNKFMSINSSLKQSAFKANFLSGLMFPVMIFMSNLAYIAVCVGGGFIAIANPLFLGYISSFVIYVRQMNQPIGQFASIATQLQSTSAASGRVFEFLEAPEQDDESHKTQTVKKVKGNVEFKDVCFGYEANKPVVKNFNHSVNSGEKIAIVGKTGAGKTTLVNLLMRFYEIDKGEILIDGVNISNMKREACRKLFSMVLQDTWLFNGSIKENLLYGNPEATEEDMVNACKAAHIDHFIRTLPGGYNHVLTDESGVSQGQRQLFTIARAMIENAPMLILDEATSSVDTRTEVLIQSAMDKLMKGKTSFIIAHRLSTIRNSDVILFMKNGNIEEKGNHNELLALNGGYAKLYNSQF